MKYFVFLAQNINEKKENPLEKVGSPSIYSRPLRIDSQDCYMVTESDDEALRRKRSDYQRVMGTRNTTYITLVTPYGVIQNSYAGNLDSVLTGDDLFYNTSPA